MIIRYKPLHIFFCNPTKLVIVFHKCVEYIVDLDNLSGRTFNENFITARNDPALRKRLGQRLYILIFYPQKIDEGNIFECNYLFSQIKYRINCLGSKIINNPL